MSKSEHLDPTTEEIDDADIALMLIGDSQEQESGFELLHEKYHHTIPKFLSRSFPGLDEHQRYEAYMETLMGLFTMIKNGTYDPDKPLLPLLIVIAKRKAIDILRKKTNAKEIPADRIDCEKESISLFDLVSETGELVRGTRLGTYWGQSDPAQRAEIIRIIVDAIPQFPTRQRQVMQIIADHLPYMPDLRTIQREASELAGENLTYHSIRRATQEVIKKIRGILRAKGYNEQGGGA